MAGGSPIFNVDGAYYAIDAICLHRAARSPKASLSRQCIVTCPWHGWQFDLTTGAAGAGSERRRHAPR